MVVDTTESKRESSGDNSISSRARSKSPFKKRTQSPFKSLAHDHPLGNSNTSRSMSAIDDLSKRTHSLASTITLTSNESSHGNNSFRNSKWSPTQTSERRLSNSLQKTPRKSPRKSPRHAFLLSNLPSGTGTIGSLPLTNSNDQAPENDRGIMKSNRRFNGVEGPPKNGAGSYYQPSKASLGNTNQSSKKPQRIRSRSKGPILRRKSNGETKAASEHSNRTSSVRSNGTEKRSKSCEPTKNKGSSTIRSKSCDRKDATSTKSKKNTSPATSRFRKKLSSSKSVEKPSSAKTKGAQDSTSTTSLHESLPKPHNASAERQKQRIEKTKVTEKSKQTERIPKSKKKETKEGNGEKPKDINDVITFFEDFAARKSETERSNVQPSRGLGEKSNSANCVTRRSHSPTARPPQSPSKCLARESSAYATRGDEDVMGTSNKRRQRRSSAPAIATTAFHQWKQSFNGSNIEDFHVPQSTHTERIMLDVSELAALEIIRLGTDNSLKLDLFDLMKHLKQQQLQQLNKKRS